MTDLTKLRKEIKDGKFKVEIVDGGFNSLFKQKIFIEDAENGERICIATIEKE